MIPPMSPREKVDCVGCEGRPAPENNPCAVCGRAALASSGDHAELARLAEAATPGPWKSIIDDTGGERSGWPLCIVPENDDDRTVVRTGGMWPYEWDAKVSQHEAVSTAAFIAAANPATVLALIAEVAALRGERDAYFGMANRSEDAWLKAERKLAEAMGHVEQLVDRLHSIRDSSIVLIAARTFLSKEAERG